LEEIKIDLLHQQQQHALQGVRSRNRKQLMIILQCVEIVNDEDNEDDIDVVYDGNDDSDDTDNNHSGII